MPPGSLYQRFCAYSYAAARRRLAPDVHNSQYEYATTLKAALRGSGRWLDLGCGHESLPSWMRVPDRALDTDGWKTVGIDMDLSSIRRHSGLNARLLGNIEHLPFQPDTFDLITANMVIEHVKDPDLLFGEIARVLAPGGTLIIHTPNVTGYTTALTRLIPDTMVTWFAGLLLGRAPEDVYPTYYRANSRSTLHHFAVQSGLAVDAFRFVASSPQLIRIPPLMLLELGLLRALERPALENYRACILATFIKPPAA